MKWVYSEKWDIHRYADEDGKVWAAVNGNMGAYETDVYLPNYAMLHEYITVEQAKRAVEKHIETETKHKPSE